MDLSCSVDFALKSCVAPLLNLVLIRPKGVIWMVVQVLFSYCPKACLDPEYRRQLVSECVAVVGSLPHHAPLALAASTLSILIGCVLARRYLLSWQGTRQTFCASRRLMRSCSGGLSNSSTSS